MNTSPQALSVELVDRISAVDADAWDALGSPDDPFSEHCFLQALEDSGSVGADSGWMPQHVVVRDGGRLLGALPLYVKGHSYGEYIFDWGWAEAARRAGLRYYPKLVSAVPFTPATGTRMRVDPGLPAERADAVRRGLVQGALHLAEAINASSFHVLFCPEDEREQLEDIGLIGRRTHQYHWQNQGYDSFEHWLSTFRSRKRKESRRERRLPTEVTLHDLPGDQLTPLQQRAVRAFYEDTCFKRGGHPYLSPELFHLFWTTLAHRSRVLLAEVDGQPVAMALLFARGGHLYGRYWGCQPDWEGLHFELCYHRPIEICIEEALDRFEAGAQGTHKIQRGLMPSPTWSAHWLAHPGLASAVSDACQREALMTQRQMEDLATHGPFRRD